MTPVAIYPLRSAHWWVSVAGNQQSDKGSELINEGFEF
jgi:hypothetical protein